MKKINYEYNELKDNINYMFLLNSPNELKYFFNFIKNHWKVNHIFLKNNDLFFWQHNGNHKYLNFVIAKDNNKIVGILGFIPSNHFDNNSNYTKIWLTMWKSIDFSDKFVGLNMIYFLKKTTSNNNFIAFGINKRVSNVYKYLNFKLGKLNHFFIVNPFVKQFLIIKTNKIEFLKIENSNKKSNIQSLVLIDKLSSIKSFKCFTKTKTYSFYFNRYVNHPVYKYMTYAIKHKKKYVGLFIIRKVQVNTAGSSCLRIIDFFGSPSNIVNCYEAFVKLLVSNNAEYIDFMNYGMSENQLTSAGFIKSSQFIEIPNHFEPLNYSSRDLLFASTFSKNLFIYKGDSDQDRPNS